MVYGLVCSSVYVTKAAVSMQEIWVIYEKHAFGYDE